MSQRLSASGRLAGDAESPASSGNLLLSLWSSSCVRDHSRQRPSGNYRRGSGNLCCCCVKSGLSQITSWVLELNKKNCLVDFSVDWGFGMFDKLHPNLLPSVGLFVLSLWCRLIHRLTLLPILAGHTYRVFLLISYLTISEPCSSAEPLHCH